MAFIEIKQLTKTYRTEEIETTALNEVSLRIEKGEFLALMGPSGCGKSTLLNVLGMLDKADAGSYTFGGEEVANLNEKKRSILRKNNIGFVFQSFNLIDELSVAENIELPLIYTKEPANERKAKVNAMLERMGLANRAKHYPQQLSGGQQQRVAVGRALITDPHIILADEPTGNLDSAHGDEVMKLLQELHEAGTTIVMVTHSEHDAQYTSRVLRLHDGMILQPSAAN